MVLDMRHGLAYRRWLSRGRFGRADLAHSLGVDLDGEQIGAHFIMQVASDAGAFFFLHILELGIKLPVAF